VQIDRLLLAARKAGASDLHLVAGVPPALRVNGEILMANADSLTQEETKALTYHLLSEAQRTAFEREQGLCVSIFHTAVGRVRLTAYYHAGNVEASIRLCNLEIPTSEELGLPPIVDELARRSGGILLVTGPTGVGKTTTLNYMVDLINRERRCKIVAIEDPVEYVHTPKRAIIVQQEVHTDTPSFSKALVHVLRQDPDIIVIGEMRDLDTIETALVAAETGHMVIATLHTPNVEQTVERIVGVFPAERQNQVLLQLTASLIGILAQRLLPRADRKGRVLATEILVATTAVRNIIREGHHHLLVSAMQTGTRDGMRTMDSVLEDLYQRGTITWDTALSNARDQDMFQRKRKATVH